MSYARFSEGDVYVFEVSVDDGEPRQWECCACLLDDDTPGTPFPRFFSLADLKTHMMFHKENDHYVPSRCWERIEQELNEGK